MRLVFGWEEAAGPEARIPRVLVQGKRESRWGAGLMGVAVWSAMTPRPGEALPLATRMETRLPWRPTRAQSGDQA